MCACRPGVRTPNCGAMSCIAAARRAGKAAAENANDVLREQTEALLFCLEAYDQPLSVQEGVRRVKEALRTESATRDAPRTQSKRSTCPESAQYSGWCSHCHTKHNEG